MSAPATATQRTHAFARVLGPFIAVVTAIVAIRAGSIGVNGQVEVPAGGQEKSPPLAG